MANPSPRADDRFAPSAKPQAPPHEGLTDSQMNILPQLLLFFCLNITLAALFAQVIGPARPAVRLVLGFAAGLILQFIVSFGIYAANLSWGFFIILPFLAGVIALRHRKPVLELLENGEVRTIILGWLIVSGWSVALQCLIHAYSGGGWAGDYIEHYERALFFLHHWPREHLFIGISGLTARPPLANVLVAAWMSTGLGGFSNFQLFNTLLCCSAFLPLALLVRQLAGTRSASAALVLLLMLNPLWVQNTTFPWTKLAAAFFILLAVERCVAGLPRGRHHGSAIILIAAGGITHYSTGPWAVALGLAWLAATYRHATHAGYWREIGRGMVVGLALVSVWIVWAATNYGPSALWSETSTARDYTAHSLALFMREFSANLWHTFVPAAESQTRDWIMNQSSVWGRLRDASFSLYQQTLPLGVGLGGLVLLVFAYSSLPGRRTALRFWSALVGLVIPLSIASHASVVDMGMAHICLQPLVLLGTTFAAAAFLRTTTNLVRIASAALTTDLLLGIGLQIMIERFWIPPWTSPREIVETLSVVARMNYHARTLIGSPYLADLFAPAGILPALFAALLLLLALKRFSLQRTAAQRQSTKIATSR